MMFLRVFGGLSVERDGSPADGAAQQRKTLALLALLAAAGRRGISRDKLCAYLWPESDAEHARQLLKQACYALRRDLHAPDLISGAGELRLNPTAITSDVGEFQDALERGELGRAVAAFTGPFLDGFYLPDAGEFERWVEETRIALARRLGTTLESLADRASTAGDSRSAAERWREIVMLDPLSGRAALGLLRALVAADDRTAALAFGRVHEQLVQQELGTAPEPAVGELLAKLRRETNGPVAAASPREPLPADGRARPHRARQLATPRRLTVGALVVVMLGVAVVAGTRHPASLDPDLLAVAPFEVLDPDLSLWREGLVDVLSRNFDGAGRFRTVAPTVVIRGWKAGRADRPTALALGSRTRAGLVVSGDLLRAGPGSVRLRAAVIDVRANRILAESDRTDLADRMDRLADSLTLDLLRALEPLGTPSVTALHAVGTASLPALKAFLHGEQQLRRFALDSAVASYDRAIALDSSFALALYHAGMARIWNAQQGPAYFARAAHYNRGLSPRDSLLVAAMSHTLDAHSPLYQRHLAARSSLLEQAARLYPEDPEVWFQLGEFRFHGVDRADWGQARVAFDRAIALDSSFALAYVHPVEIVLRENDREAARRYVRGYLAIRSVMPEAAAMDLLASLLDGPKPGRAAVAGSLDNASSGALRRLAFAVRFWPDIDETQIETARRLLGSTHRNPASAPTDTVQSVALLSGALVFRGHLREARLLVARQLRHPAFMPLAEMGAIPADTVERVLAAWLARPGPAALALHPWLAAGPCYRTQGAAAWWAVHRDMVNLRRLAQREDSAARVVDYSSTPPYARPQSAFLRAAMALAAGDSVAALRGFLAIPDTLCPGADQLRTLQFRLLAAARRDGEAIRVFDRLRERSVPLVLERARMAERLGDRAGAQRYYEIIAEAWRNADPELHSVVAESRAALQRLRS